MATKRSPSENRKAPKQERSRETVAAIVTATRLVLERYGPEGATTNRIAEVAGVSIGSLYQYFPNKESLIERVRGSHDEAFRSRIEPEAERMVTLPIEDAIRSLVGLLIELHRGSLPLHNALASAEEPSDFHLEFVERWLPTTVAYLETHRAALRPSNLELAARIALTALEALTHDVARLTPELLEDEAYAEELSQLLLGYLSK